MPLGVVSFAILGAVVWFTLVAMAWIYAPKRHRNPVNWAILTFFTFGVALVFLVVMQPGHWQGHVPGKAPYVDPRSKEAEVPHSEHHGSGHQQSHHHGSEGKKK
jgi:hypothetical protein